MLCLHADSTGQECTVYLARMLHGGVTVRNVVKLRMQDVVQNRPHAGGNRTGRRRQFGNVRVLPSGKFQASYLGPDGERHNAPTTFQTKGDANTWLAMQQSKIIEHRWKPAPPPSSTLTLADYAETWLRGRELKPRTRAEYQRLLDTKILPQLGRKPLSAVTPVDVRMWYTQLDPTTKTRRAHAYALLRTILGTAVTEELIEANPAHIKGAGGYKRQHQIRPASLAELTTITEHMPARYRLMVLLASWCALRYGELAELRRSDIDLDGGVPKASRSSARLRARQVLATWQSRRTSSERLLTTTPSMPNRAPTGCCSPTRAARKSTPAVCIRSLGPHERPPAVQTCAGMICGIQVRCLPPMPERPPVS
jgi:hypothetical protein